MKKQLYPLLLFLLVSTTALGQKRAGDCHEWQRAVYKDVVKTIMVSDSWTETIIETKAYEVQTVEVFTIKGAELVEVCKNGLWFFLGPGA